MTAEIFRNPARVQGRGPRSLAEGDSPLGLHRELPDYRPTPLLSAPALAAELGLSRLWVKVESERFGLPAFKMLGASWATFRLLCSALAERGLAGPREPTLVALRDALGPLGALTLAAATDGNHGRAVARTASLLGCAARIFVPRDMARARVDAIAGEGAEVVRVDGTYDDAVELAARQAFEDAYVVSDTSWEGYTDVPGWVIDGYRTIFHEIEAQLEGEVPDIAAVQMGVGALAAAAVDALGTAPSIAIVEPTVAACGLRSAQAGAPTEVPGPHDSIMSGLNCGNVSPLAWPRVVAGAELFVAIDDAAAVRAMRDLALVGVVAGETGAAGLAGLRAAIEAGPELGIDPAGRSALVICTEGATDPEAYARLVPGADLPA